LAGKMGITLVLIAIMRNFSDAFLGSYMPRLNIMVAQKREKEVLKRFIYLFWGALGVNILGGLVIVFFTKIIYKFPVGLRFLDLKLTIFLVLINIAVNIVGILQNYCLLHKDGSFYPLSILAGFIGIVSMFIVYRLFSLDKAFVFLLSNWALMLCINVFVFIHKKNVYMREVMA
jgi:hypothetical protein